MARSICSSSPSSGPAPGKWDLLPLLLLFLFGLIFPGSLAVTGHIATQSRKKVEEAEIMLNMRAVQLGLSGRDDTAD